MAFRFPSTPDPRIHRLEDEYLAPVTAKGSVQRTGRASPSDGALPPVDANPHAEHEKAAEPVLLPPQQAPPRKHIVFADPFAFRFVAVTPGILTRRQS